MSSQDSVVNTLGSDAETDASITAVLATPASVEEIHLMMEDLDDLKTTAAAWNALVPHHAYSQRLKEDINTLIYDITIMYTNLGDLATKLFMGVIDFVDREHHVAKLGDIRSQWCALKAASMGFIERANAEIDDAAVVDESDADEHRDVKRARK